MSNTELRIGNWVTYPMFGEMTIDSGIEIDQFIEAAGSPIQLTEEWLLKFGFNKSNVRPDHDIDYSKNYDFYYVTLEGWIPFVLNDFLVGIRGGEFYALYEGISADESCYFYQNGVQLKYVHQLQNLYFSLTGTELTLPNQMSER